MKFKNISLMQWKRAVFYALFISMIVIQLVNADNNIWGNGIDEAYYKDVTQRIVNTGTVQGLFETLKDDFETKTAPFIGLHVVLRMYETKVYARAFNALLILIISYLVYDMTKRKESFLIPIIPWFLNSLWLTNEIIEVFFVILAVRFAQFSGLLIGIGTLFRPWTLFYSVLLKQNQIKYVVMIGMIYVLILFYYDSFLFYLYKVFHYSVIAHGFTSGNEPIDWVSILFCGLFLFLGYKTKMFWFGIVSMISLSTKLYAHYFVPSMILFYFGYLLQLKIQTQKEETQNVFHNQDVSIQNYKT